MMPPDASGLTGALKKIGDSASSAFTGTVDAVSKAFAPAPAPKPSATVAPEDLDGPPRLPVDSDDWGEMAVAYYEIAKSHTVREAKAFHGRGYTDKETLLGFAMQLRAVLRRRFTPNISAKQGAKFLVQDLKASLSPAPADAKTAYLLWTAICVTYGALWKIAAALMGSGPWWWGLLLLVLELAFGLVVAYTLYFVFVLSRVVPWMKASLAFLALFAFLPALFSGFALPQVMAMLFNGVLLLHSVNLYKRALETGADSAYAYVYLDDGTPVVGQPEPPPPPAAPFVLPPPAPLPPPAAIAADAASDSTASSPVVVERRNFDATAIEE